MEYRFEIAPRAMAEANATYEWIARESPRRAARWYQGLFARIETLSTDPHRFARAPEADLLDLDLRQLVYGRRGHAYRILFTVEGDVVRIVSIRHGARDLLRPSDLGQLSPSSNTQTPKTRRIGDERVLF